MNGRRRRLHPLTGTADRSSATGSDEQMAMCGFLAHHSSRQGRSVHSDSDYFPERRRRQNKKISS